MKTKKNSTTADTSTTHFPLYQNYHCQGTVAGSKIYLPGTGIRFSHRH